MLCSSAFAGFRAHELKVVHYDVKGKATKTEVVVTTLDHLQYEHYHGGYGNLQVSLVDTWYCPGDTHGKPMCKKPKAEPKRGPASTDPKRPGLPYGRQPYIP